MDLEFHQLEMRYESLRVSRPVAEKRLLTSLAAVGQLLPVVVVASGVPDRFVLVDGYKRVRLLKRLSQDTVRSLLWDLNESDALLLDRFMRTQRNETTLEQGWLLREMADRFDLSLDELARRFGRSESWVSRRLALVRELPEQIQERVRRGELVAHAAMKYLVPLARANLAQCLQMVDGIAGRSLSSRQIGMIYTAWRAGAPEVRERIVASPILFLRAHGEHEQRQSEALCRALLRDFDIVSCVALRAANRLEQAPTFTEADSEDLERAFRHVMHSTGRLSRCVKERIGNAASGAAAGNYRASEARA